MGLAEARHECQEAKAALDQEQGRACKEGEAARVALTESQKAESALRKEVSMLREALEEARRSADEEKAEAVSAKKLLGAELREEIERLCSELQALHRQLAEETRRSAEAQKAAEMVRYACLYTCFHTRLHIGLSKPCAYTSLHTCLRTCLLNTCLHTCLHAGPHTCLHTSTHVISLHRHARAKPRSMWICERRDKRSRRQGPRRTPKSWPT